MPDIPIIGQPDDVLQWYPTILIRHRCKSGVVTILVVTGFQNPVACGNCGRVITAGGDGGHTRHTGQLSDRPVGLPARCRVGAMSCPYCKNDDQRLIERTPRGWLCIVCSKLISIKV